MQRGFDTGFLGPKNVSRLRPNYALCVNYITCRQETLKPITRKMLSKISLKNAASPRRNSVLFCCQHVQQGELEPSCSEQVFRTQSWRCPKVSRSSSFSNSTSTAKQGRRHCPKKLMYAPNNGRLVDPTSETLIIHFPSRGGCKTRR